MVCSFAKGHNGDVQRVVCAQMLCQCIAFPVQPPHSSFDRLSPPQQKICGTANVVCDMFLLCLHRSHSIVHLAWSFLFTRTYVRTVFQSGKSMCASVHGHPLTPIPQSQTLPADPGAPLDPKPPSTQNLVVCVSWYA